MSYLQQLLQQGKAKAGDATEATDPLSMLMQSLSGDGSSGSQTGAATSTASGASVNPSVPPIGSDAMRVLITVQGEETGNGAESKFFAKLDSDGDGQISQSEFSTAASNVGADSAVADAVFAKIDADGDGSVSQGELAKADQGGHHHRVGGGPPPPDGGGAAAIAGATTTTTANADGSTTTTITYADGSKINMTTPATASAGNDSDGVGSGGGSSKPDFSKSASNMLEQLIRLQSQMLNVATSTLSAVA
jgi:hypothetical protein